MSKVLCEKSDLVAIADSIRSKTGSTDGMKVAEIPQKIEAIETGSNINIQASKSVTYTSNGTATITPDAGYDGLSSVDVTVNVASGGGSGAFTKWDDVTFIDYDGSVLYSYSLAEAQALAELPPRSLRMTDLSVRVGTGRWKPLRHLTDLLPLARCISPMMGLQGSISGLQRLAA